MNDRELFHDAMLPYGGRFPRELAPVNVRQLYDEIVDRADDLISSARRFVPKLPPIHFDFVHEAKINARAFRSHDRYFIGINTGTVFMLRSLIGRMLADSRTFITVGTPTIEHPNLATLVPYVTDANEMAKRGPLATPLDHIRGSYAWYLQDQAIMFLVGHELTHITHGHVDFMKDRHGANFIAELDWFGKRDKEQILESQCLEQDADRRSTISRIDSLRITSLKVEMKDLPWNSTLPWPGQLILDWFVSVNILFRLFGDSRFDPSKLLKANYPPFLLRLVMCEVAAMWTIKNKWDSKLNTIATHALARARGFVEMAYGAAMGGELTIESHSEAISAGRDHAQKLEDYWNSVLVEKVRPFSYEF